MDDLGSKVARMLFHDTQFILFFLVVFVVFWAIHHLRMPRVLFLLASSYFFYMGWSAKYALLIVFQTVSDYYIALWLVKLKNERIRTGLVVGSAIVNLSILALFKYYGFFTESFQAACEWFGWSVLIPKLNVLLPVGISFYTFHCLSYTLDVYYRKIEPARNLFEFALAVVFFPQLVAGPIVRASQFLPQLEATPKFNLEQFRSGLLLFFIGLIKKSLIADTLAEMIVDPAFKSPGMASGPHLLLAIYAYAFQIYGDFAGYSDMAMGTARMLGYELPINFNLPYRAQDLREFWRRWHISLSTFLRDYLYIPLGGNRGSIWATCRNLMITMLLGGLWHGAAWTFVLWGFYHGLLLVIQHLWDLYRGKQPARVDEDENDNAWCSSWASLLRVFVTFHLVCLGWLFFRAQSFSDIGIILTRIFSWAQGTSDIFIRERGLWFILLAVLMHLAPRQWVRQAINWFVSRSPEFQGTMAAALIGVMGIFATANHPFIYFQF